MRYCSILMLAAFATAPHRRDIVGQYLCELLA